MAIKQFCIYVHRNKLNGKLYIGITSQVPERRWNSGRGYNENPHFRSAIEKYGWDGFDHIVIADGLSEEQAKKAEKFYISMFNTNNNKNGYNMTTGGDGTNGYYPSEETRHKLSELRRRENLSDETRRKRSESLRNRRLSDEHKAKIGAGNSKAIIMMSLSGEFIKKFNSASEAENETGVNHTHISQCCNGKRNTSGGYSWKFAQ